MLGKKAPCNGGSLDLSKPFDFQLITRSVALCSFNPIQDGLFRGCIEMVRVGVAKRSTLPKICFAYPTLMKLGTVAPYLRKIQKIYESRDTPL